MIDHSLYILVDMLPELYIERKMTEHLAVFSHAHCWCFVHSCGLIAFDARFYSAVATVDTDCVTTI